MEAVRMSQNGLLNPSTEDRLLMNPPRDGVGRRGTLPRAKGRERNGAL